MNASVTTTTFRAEAASTRARLPSFLLGVGFGGFLDGIVLHQVLQWHHMLTATGERAATSVGGLEDNVLADAFFHIATWIVVFAGSILAIRAWQRRELAPPWRSHIGLLLAGWGVFNLFEGIVDHHVLTIHHVRDDVSNQLPWDLGFLAFGAALLVAGFGLWRSGEAARAQRRS